MQAPRASPMTAFYGVPREKHMPYVRCPPSPPNALGLTLKVRRTQIQCQDVIQDREEGQDQGLRCNVTCRLIAHYRRHK